MIFQKRIILYSQGIKKSLENKLYPYRTFWSKYCGLIIKNKSFHVNNFQTHLEGRVISLDIALPTHNITVVCTYAPNNPSDRVAFLLNA